MHKTLKQLLLLTLFLLCWGTAYAETSFIVVSPSGATDLSSPTYKIPVDIKGQPVTGKSTSPNYILNLGGIYGLIGKQLVIAENVAWGTVPIFISRSGENIKIAWNNDLYGENIGIFMRTGSGIGEYQNNAAAWNNIDDNAGEFEKHLADGYVLHKTQVGANASHKEAYYKALQTGIDKTTVNPQGVNCLETAQAVGKVDLTISGGKKWSALSIPFMDLPQDLDSLIGIQGNYAAGAEPSSSVLVFSFENGSWNRVSYFDGAKWQPLSPSPAVYDGDKGLYIRTKPDDQDKTITIVGKVKFLSVPTNYTLYPNWNILGFPYPTQLNLSNIGLTVGKKGTLPENSDLIFGFKNNSWNTVSYLTEQGWQAPKGAEGVDLINAGQPLYYRSRSAGNIPWTLTPVGP